MSIHNKPLSIPNECEKVTFKKFSHKVSNFDSPFPPCTNTKILFPTQPTEFHLYQLSTVWTIWCVQEILKMSMPYRSFVVEAHTMLISPQQPILYCLVNKNLCILSCLVHKNFHTPCCLVHESPYHATWSTRI